MITELTTRLFSPESRIPQERRIFDLSKTDIQNAQAIALQILDAHPGPRDVIIDVDGPLINAKRRFYRVGYSIGNLPQHSREFLGHIVQSESLRPIIFTARVSEGRLGTVLNADGNLVTRLTQHRDHDQTELMQEFIRLGIPEHDILYPRDNARYLLAYKLIILADLRHDRTTEVEDVLRPNIPFTYIGDTRTDLAIFHHLAAKKPSDATYIRFPQAYSLGIF